MSHNIDQKSQNFYISPNDAQEFFQKFPDAAVQYKGHTLYNAIQVKNHNSSLSDGNFPVNPGKTTIQRFPGWDPDGSFGLG